MIDEEWDKDLEYIRFLHETVCKESWRLIKRGGVCVFTCSNVNKPYFYEFFGNVSKGKTKKEYDLNIPDFKFINEITWFKPNAAPFMMCKQHGRNAPSCEFIMIYSKGVPKFFDYQFLRNDKTKYELELYNKQDAQMKDFWAITDEPWIINQTQGNWINPDEQRHAAQKPRKLIERIIKTYSKEGDTVLDPCFGSCGIGLICKELNRNFIGIDSEQKWVDAAYKILEK